MAKFLSAFGPARDKTVDEANEYYLTRHVPFVRDFFLNEVAAMELYVTQVALRSWSDGRVGEPSAWRWVVSERRRGTEYRPSRGNQARLDSDHVAFLSGLRAFYLKPVVVINRGGRVGKGCKVIIEHAAAELSAMTVAREQYKAQQVELLPKVLVSDGVALFIANDVRAELATQAITEPMQKLGHGFLDATDKVAVDEVWFRDEPAAERFLESATLWDLWNRGRTAPAVHQVTELVVLDRR